MNSLPKVSIDVVPLRVLNDGTVQVGLNKRAAEPFTDQLALPGVLLLGNERLEAAGFRALKTKAGITPDGVRWMRQVATFDSPDRDPRGHTLSVVMFAVINDAFESVKTEWFTVAEIPPLPFDHNDIISTTLKSVAEKVWSDSDLIYAFMGNSFSTSRAYRFMGIVSGQVPDAANFNRRIASSPLLKDTGYTEPTGKGRPSKVWAVTG